MIYGIRINNRERQVFEKEWNSEKESDAAGQAREFYAMAKTAALPDESGAIYCRQSFGAGVTLERFAI